MKKYYLYDGATQHGPFNFEELKEKNISAETSIWFDPMPGWKPAGEIEELKDIVIHMPPVFHAATAQVVETKEVVIQTVTEPVQPEQPMEPVITSVVAEPVVIAAIAEPIAAAIIVEPVVTAAVAEPIAAATIVEPVVI